MLGFNPSTQPVAMKEWVTPLDPSIYAQGVANQTKKLEAQSAQDSELYNSFMNIQAIAPQDEEQLQTLKQSFEKELSGLSMGDLRNPQTKAQLSQIQNKYTNLLLESGIPQRTSSYKQELAAKKEAESKGRQYVSPLLRQASKYIQDGNFDKDTRFNQQGFVAPDNKELDEIAKNTPEWIDIVTNKGGYDVTQKGKAESKLQANYLAHFKNNPQWSQLLNDQFEQETEGLDLSVVAQQGFTAIQQMFPHLPPQQQQQAYQDLQEGLQIQQQNPYAEGAWKQKLRDDYFSNQAYMAAQAKTYVNTVDKKANEYSKIAVQHQNAKELAKEKEEIKSQYRNVAGNTKIDPVRRARLVAASTNLGVDIADPAQADGYISNEALDDLGVLKGQTAANKAEDTKLKVGDKDYTKTEIIANINSGNKDFIKDFMNSYLPEGAEEVEVVGENINYDTNDVLGTPGSFDKTIKKSDLLKLIEDSKIDVDI
jgi:hypothetical protein